MLSIAIFSECYHPMLNGVAVSVSSFARILAEMGHAVTIFTVSHPDQHGQEDGVYRFPSVMLPSRARYPLAIPIAPGDARSLLQEQHFDVIHSNSLMLMGYVAKIYHRRWHIPLVFTYHTLLEEYTHYIPLPQTLLRQRAIELSRRYANTADHVITPAAHVAERLRRYHVTRPITVIPTGIDLEVIDAASASDFRERFAIPPGTPLLLYVGRLAREKNIARLLGSFRLVQLQEPNAHLVLLGGGMLEMEIRAQIEEMHLAHRVRMTGYLPRDTVLQGLHAADIFVFASKSETQGLAIGEAMACGLPVVAVASEAAAEIITPQHEGLLTMDADESFADAILSLLRDTTLRKHMGRQARKSAEGLSARRCTERLVGVYRQVIANKEKVNSAQAG